MDGKSLKLKTKRRLETKMLKKSEKKFIEAFYENGWSVADITHKIISMRETGLQDKLEKEIREMLGI